MNTKGLKLDKKLAFKIYNSYDSISLQNMRGINPFVSFSWIGFSREEFKSLMREHSCSLATKLSKKDGGTDLELVLILTAFSAKLCIELEQELFGRKELN